jgi:tetratricopeptide (TPR) repeat protein
MPNPHIVDARYSTSTDVCGDQIINYYGVTQRESSGQPPSSLSFNDAPLDLLSSYFTGREDELDQIEKEFNMNHGNVPTRCAIHSMPGMGKTQLALQYAMRSYLRQVYPIIFWISGATVEKLNKGLTKVLTLVGHPDRDHPEQTTRLTLARRWLEESGASGSGKWLLIFDNVAQEAVGFLKEHLPRKNLTGNILFTTRTPGAAETVTAVAGQQHRVIELYAPDLNNAANQLLKEAGVDMNNAGPGTMSGAEALVKCVGRLPLAITHAASLARQSHNNLDYVLGLYKSAHKYEVSVIRSVGDSFMLTVCGLLQLIRLENNMSNYEQRSVAVTFDSQINELESHSLAYSQLLRVLSFFDPESIPLEMIAGGVDDLQPRSASKLKPFQSVLSKLETKLHQRQGKRREISEGLTNNQTNTSVTTHDRELESLIALVRSPVQRGQAIHYLRQLSLVGYKSTEDTSALRIHDLIQITIQENVRRNGTQDHWFHVAVILACSAFRRVEDPFSHRCWAQCEIFHPHIQSLTKWDDDHHICNSELRQANMRIGQYLKSSGRHSEAEALFKRAFASTNTQLGPEHPEVLTINQNIASVYWRQGRYKEAEELCRRVLTGRGKVLKANHPNILETMHTFATVYRLQERFEEAESLYRKVLTKREKVLGLNHPHTLQTVNSLAVLCHSQDRFNEAETLFRRALVGREKLLGPEHIETLSTVHSLAIVYELQERFEEAETLRGRALKGQETLLGLEHPHTLRTVQVLASSYHLHQQYGEAESLYRRALTGRRKVLGSDHPDTLISARELSKFFEDQSRHEEAIVLWNDFPLAFK